MDWTAWDWKLILQIVGIALGLLYLWLEYRVDIRLWIVGLVMPLVHGTLFFKAGLYADCSMQAYYVLAGIYGWYVWSRTRKKGLAAAAGAAQEPAGSAARQQTAGKVREAADGAAQEPEAVGAGQAADGAAQEPAAVGAGQAADGQAADGAARQTDASGRTIAHTPRRMVLPLAAVYVAAHAGLYLLLTRFTDSTVPFWDAGTTAASIVAMWMLSRKYVEQWLVWLVVDVVTVWLYAYKGISFTAGLYTLYSLLAVAGYLRWRRLAAGQGTAATKAA